MSIFREHFDKRFFRSNKWSKVRKEHLKDNNYCSICGKTERLEVHHIIPFAAEPSLELELNNLVTLCRDHHFIFGHLGKWKSYNININVDVNIWNIKYNTRP